ncbi:hypothetical protein I6J48_05255 [Acinetobacter calcoaceticus]|uniref:LA2681 family HEPN domain-containing protein n=1 Tax=Acinetobacter calcoaceticus TaxID=471 RepID=UPI00196895B6|nr:LA2681 family HEPN domain-containing protein [Acinetobacter calcoaceticus]QSB55083.1 hypothetical protein I6J48_05255 [Acinetobacter calcoaceticus]
MLTLKKINEAINAISNSIDQDKWIEALSGAEIILEELEKFNKNSTVLHLRFNLASQFIDAGTYLQNETAISKGIKILEIDSEYYEREFNITYYYNLANGKLALANDCGYSKEKINFKNIELFNTAKNLYWKAFKLIKEDEKYDLYQQNLINLANILKQQFRFSEALQIYNIVIEKNTSYPQAWLNRSSCLEQFDNLLDHRTEKMIIEIIKGYDFACQSNQIPNDWKPFYENKSTYLRKQLGDNDLEKDEVETLKEYSTMSHFRQWCINKNLTLNIHGLYCSCIANERDTLTLFDNIIATTGIKIYEQYLNRIKSEFSLLRHLYYESLHSDNSTTDYESCYSELYENEIINLKNEKLRTCFRLCFSILDKLAIILCTFFKCTVQNNTSFNNFWFQNKNILDGLENPFLISINSIIHDLNDKYGEFGFYKEWRNKLEHNLLFLIPDDYECLNDQDHMYIKINHFENNLKNLIQITRSAIFSTVFTLLHEYRKNESNDNLYKKIVIGKKNFDIID